jgi:hypothetical protein
MWTVNVLGKMLGCTEQCVQKAFKHTGPAILSCPILSRARTRTKLYLSDSMSLLDNLCSDSQAAYNQGEKFKLKRLNTDAHTVAADVKKMVSDGLCLLCFHRIRSVPTHSLQTTTHARTRCSVHTLCLLSVGDGSYN